MNEIILITNWPQAITVIGCIACFSAILIALIMRMP